MTREIDKSPQGKPPEPVVTPEVEKQDVQLAPVTTSEPTQEHVKMELVTEQHPEFFLKDEEAEQVLLEAYDLISTYLSSRNLPDELNLEKNPNQYLLLLLQILKMWSVIDMPD